MALMDRVHPRLSASLPKNRLRIVSSPIQRPAWSRSPWVRTAAVGVAVWAASRLALAAFTWLFAIYNIQAHGGTTDGHPFSALDLFHMWWQWDAELYHSVAQAGYYRRDLYAFFPLYPGLTHLASAPFGVLFPTIDPGMRTFLAELFVANVGTLIACIGMAFLAAREDASRQTVTLFLAYPLALFLAAAYTEGVFLACAVWVFVCLQRRWWLGAALALLLAGLTRSTALALVPTVLVAVGRELLGEWRDMGRLHWRRVSAGLALLAAEPVAIGSYALYCWQRTGDPLIFVHVQKDWGRVTTAPWISFGNILGTLFRAPYGVASYSTAFTLLDLIPLAGCAALTLVMLRRAPLEETLYMIGLLALAVAAPKLVGGDYQMLSAGRFMVAAVPVWRWLGCWARRWPLLETYGAAFGWMLQAACLGFFLLGGWVG